MTRGAGRAQQCTKLVLGEEDGGASLSVATGNAVLAAIAAADAICCHANGTRWRGQNHRDAAEHVAMVTADSKLAGLLSQVLDDKDAAHYGLDNVRRAKAKSAVRRANQLVEAARARVR